MVTKKQYNFIFRISVTIPEQNSRSTCYFFSKHAFSEHTLDILASVSDVIAQEIARRKVKDRLNDRQQRYLTFIKQSSEGIWRFELKKPMSTQLSVEKQIDHFYKYAYLAECNDAMAKMYGYKSAEEVIGARLADILVRDNKNNVTYLKSFIKSSYNLSGAESFEVDKNGMYKYFQNNLIDIVENGYLVRAWGIQRDITDRKLAEQELLKLSNQKDEFIAVVSHELKTPITSIKAFAQILQEQFAHEGNEKVTVLLLKMTAQINKFTTLIDEDFLDVTKIEKEKLILNEDYFYFDELVDEIL